jgi:hypothetical protein
MNDVRKRRGPDPAFVREIYIDETSQTKHRYLLLGALSIPQLDKQDALRAITAARLPQLPHGEMKWGKVSPSKISAYQRIVGAFFEHTTFSNSHFHCIVIDTSRLDDKKYNNSDREVGFNKEVYQLASKCARLYPRDFFHVYPDHRETPYPPEQLRLILNSGRRKAGDPRSWPFRRWQFQDSKSSLLLQLTDILLGAVAYQVNGHAQSSEASPTKLNFSKYILEKAKIRDAMADTPMAGKFTVWHRRLR